MINGFIGHTRFTGKRVLCYGIGATGKTTVKLAKLTSGMKAPPLPDRFRRRVGLFPLPISEYGIKKGSRPGFTFGCQLG